MRVLFITTAYPANGGDSRGSFIRDLASELARQGVNVTVLAPGAPGAPKHEQRDGVTIERATYWIPRGQRLAIGLGGIIPNLRRQPWLLLQVPTLAIALIQHACRLAHSFDVIHAHWVYPCGIAGAIASRRTGRPLIVTSHGGDLNLAVRSWPLRELSRWVARRAKVCLGVSHAMVERFREIGAAPNRIRFLPLGVSVLPTASNSVDAIETDLQSFAGFPGLRVVFAGSLIPRKSVETLLLAVAELRRRQIAAALLVIGTGPSEAGLRRAVANLQLDDVYFAGDRAPSAVPGLMSLGQVLVLPSRSEGRGLVLVEAMALGMAVVASDIPGPRELVREGETGLVFPVGNAERLADQLERLQDLRLREQLGRAARSLVDSEGLTVKESASRHRALYAELARRDGTAV